MRPAAAAQLCSGLSASPPPLLIARSPPLASSASLPARGALLHEGFHPLAAVLGGKEEGEGPSLKGEAGAQRELEGETDRLLGRPQGEWWLGGDGGGQVQGGLQGRFGWDDPVHQP